MFDSITIFANAALSVAGYGLASVLIAEFLPIFIARKMYGRDQCKREPTQTPEPMGIVAACVYLIIMFLFTPVPFYGWLLNTDSYFPHVQFVEFLSGLLSILCMILFGFADDVFDLRWRHKLMLPSLASLPLLVVYAANFSSTTIIVPRFLTGLLGPDLNLHFLYYIYMGMVAVFCTNAINILAGVNGLEAGQSIVIAVSVVLFNVIQLLRGEAQAWYQWLSLYFLLPYISTSLALLKYNWYPARVFVGDTFCYFSGMTFAVVGILGHYSKTLLLFFLPQIANFLYSVPQLFHFIPCPRHRLPRYDPKTDLLTMSTVIFKYDDLSVLGKLILNVAERARLLYVKRGVGEDGKLTECNNMTILNWLLWKFGPMHERKLTIVILTIQVAFSCVAFVIRFPMAGWFYDHVH